MPGRYNQTNFSSSPAKEETANHASQGKESALARCPRQPRCRARFAVNVLGAVALAAICAVRIANSEALPAHSESAALNSALDSQAVYKADFIDDFIDIITGGGGDDDEEDPEPTTKP